jgi:hypothetical protein
MDSIEPEPARSDTADEGFLKRGHAVWNYGQPLARGIDVM